MADDPLGVAAAELLVEALGERRADMAEVVQLLEAEGMLDELALDAGFEEWSDLTPLEQADWLTGLLCATGRLHESDVDGKVQATLPRLARATFTHRLTDAECEAGFVDVDRSVDLVLVETPRGVIDLAGRDVRPGDVIAVTTGDNPSIDPTWLVVDSSLVGDGAHELAAISRSAAGHGVGEDGRGGDAYAIVWDALAIDDETFPRAEPYSPPIGELLASAGLVRRHGEWGLAAGPFVTSLERRRSRDLAELIEEAEVSPPARQALRQIADAIDAHGRGDTPLESSTIDGLDLPDAAEVIVAWIDAGTYDATRRAELVIELLGDSAGVGARLVRGAAFALVGRAIEAVAELEAVTDVDPDRWTAHQILSELDEDRADAEAAVRRIRSHGMWNLSVFDETLAEVAPSMRSEGRNDPCPCGSGRKFKACCLGRPAMALATRYDWLIVRATRVVGKTGSSLLAVLEATAAAATGADDEDELFTEGDPFFVDLVLFEGGGFAQYLRARADVLVDEERATLEGWLQARRRVWVVEDRSSSGVSLRPLDGGEAVAVHSTDPFLPEVGELLLARASASWAGNRSSSASGWTWPIPTTPTSCGD